MPTLRRFFSTHWRDVMLLPTVVLLTAGIYRITTHPVPRRPVTAAVQPTPPAPDPLRIVAVDTMLNVVCYKVEGQVSCVWIQSVSKVKRQLGLD